MILIAKKLGRFYRRFERDIWGICYTDDRATEVKKLYKKSWIIKFFFKIFRIKLYWRWKKRRRYIYRIDIIDIRPRKKKYNIRWLSIRLTRLYFLILQEHQFRKMFIKARKLTGDLETNYCYLLEGRLFPLFYRTNFVSTLFKAMAFIKDKNVLLNFKYFTNWNTLVDVGSFISLNKKYKLKLKYKLLKRLKLKAILFTTPRFLFISFRFWWALFLKKPRKRDLVYPIPLDIQRITGYY